MASVTTCHVLTSPLPSTTAKHSFCNYDFFFKTNSRWKRLETDNSCKQNRSSDSDSDTDDDGDLDFIRGAATCCSSGSSNSDEWSLVFGTTKKEKRRIPTVTTTKANSCIGDNETRSTRRRIALIEQNEKVAKNLSLASFDSTIPIIDLSLPIDEIVEKVRLACTIVGFFYITNYQHIVNINSKDTFEMAKKFFNLPLKKKLSIDRTKSTKGMKGFFELQTENLENKDGGTRSDIITNEERSKSIIKNKSKVGDYKEGFDCGREISSDHDSIEEQQDIDQNQWISNDILPNFKEIMIQYQNQMMILSQFLLKIFALSLNLSDEEYFASKFKKPMAILRLLHYPPSASESTSKTTTTPSSSSSSNTSDVGNEDVIGCGAHTDYGCCTLLNQDDTGGLQVYNNHKKKWIDVPYIENSLVINLGDMMSRWTNDRYKSTLHRVVNSNIQRQKASSSSSNNKDRYSIPFFLNPTYGTLIECISTNENGEEPKYPPERSEIILKRRYEEAFSKH